MTAKAGSKRAGNPVRVASTGTARARRGANGRMVQPGEAQAGGALPAMHASARRDAVRASEAVRSPRKAKRAKRTPGLGGRLAAAIRTARLRAGRAAEEFGLRR